MLRVVLDPGVLVSAVLAASGPPGAILDRWRDGEFDLLVSPKLLNELEDVLLRPRFRHVGSEDEVRAYVEALARGGVGVRDPDEVPAVTADPDDDYLVAMAVAARADVIVSGDSHLTGLVDPPVAVLPPREFVERLDRS